MFDPVVWIAQSRFAFLLHNVVVGEANPRGNTRWLESPGENRAPSGALKMMPLKDDADLMVRDLEKGRV